MHLPTPLVINWHLTEACNYRCQYCYATWSPSSCRRELIHDSEKTTALLSALYQFFQPGSPNNPLTQRMNWSSVRLNLAGGEPLLYAEETLAIVHEARRLGFEVSMISNGSYMTAELLNQLAAQLTWLGISIDSAIPEINHAIGRVDPRGQLINLKELLASLHQVRQLHPSLQIKLNTVVNQLNHDEDLSALIQHLQPSKWKVLRMLPVVNQLLAVTDEQFAGFVARHQDFASILCAEDNQDMRESYLMVDPHGRFFQNSPLIPGQGYQYSQPILDVGTAAAFAEMRFDPTRFAARYIPIHAEVGA